MINISDLVRLGQLYLPGSLDDPAYIITGGSAVFCWLHNTPDCRQHRDIDVFVLKPNQFPLPSTDNSSPYFVGRLTKDGIIAGRAKPIIEVQTVSGCYYDAEIIPGKNDARLVSIKNSLLPVLSPEFLVVSKLTYPNVHRSFDFSDVLALNRLGFLRDFGYFNKLLTQTSLGELIEANDILHSKSEAEFTALLNHIHYLLVQQFLYWELINVEVLDTFQCFVLLDIVDDLFGLSPEVRKLLNSAFNNLELSGTIRQLAMLGYCFLASELPPETLARILQGSNLQKILSRYLPDYSSQYLSCFKRLLMIFKTVSEIEKLTKHNFDVIWHPTTIDNIINRAVLTDFYTFTLLVSVKAIYEDLTSNRITVRSGVHQLISMLA